MTIAGVCTAGNGSFYSLRGSTESAPDGEQLTMTAAVS